MRKEGHSSRGFFGNINHYDASGRKIGESRRNFWGGMTNYDANGHKTGESRRGFFGGVNHYDNSGRDHELTNPGIFMNDLCFGAYVAEDCMNFSTITGINWREFAYSPFAAMLLLGKTYPANPSGMISPNPRGILAISPGCKVQS